MSNSIVPSWRLRSFRRADPVSIRRTSRPSALSTAVSFPSSSHFPSVRESRCSPARRSTASQVVHIIGFLLLCPAHDHTIDKLPERLVYHRGSGSLPPWPEAGFGDTLPVGTDHFPFTGDPDARSLREVRVAGGAGDGLARRGVPRGGAGGARPRATRQPVAREPFAREWGDPRRAPAGGRPPRGAPCPPDPRGGTRGRDGLRRLQPHRREEPPRGLRAVPPGGDAPRAGQRPPDREPRGGRRRARPRPRLPHWRALPPRDARPGRSDRLLRGRRDRPRIRLVDEPGLRRPPPGGVREPARSRAARRDRGSPERCLRRGRPSARVPDGIAARHAARRGAPPRRGAAPPADRRGAREVPAAGPRTSFRRRPRAAPDA